MTDPFLLYISAANDMEAERDLLARSVIAVPADLTWRIEQSPRSGDPVNREAITKADLHLLLLGGDIRAPIGLEWLVARRIGRLPWPLLKEGASRTLAAEDFRRFIERQQPWRPFSSPAQLQRQVQRLLGQTILDNAVGFGLPADEIVALQAWLSELNQAPGVGQATPEVRREAPGGAGESSVILPKERYEPSSGILLRPVRGDQAKAGS